MDFVSCCFLNSPIWCIPVLYNLQNQMHINLIYQAVSDDCVLEK